MKQPEHIGMGCLGNGTTIWDRTIEKNGDFKILAHIQTDGTLTLRCKRYKKGDREYIEHVAEFERIKHFELENLDQTAIRELELYIINDGELYSSQRQSIDRNMSRKHKAGKYDFNLSIKAYMSLVDNGAKKYIKDHCSKGDSWFAMFPKAERLEVARSIAQREQKELEIGNYTE